MSSIRPSTYAGTPVTMKPGAVPSRSGQYRRTISWFAPMPPLVTITACARQLELADRLAVRGHAAGRVVVGQHRAAHAGDGAVGDHELVHPVPVVERQQPGGRGLRRQPDERLDDARSRCPR